MLPALGKALAATLTWNKFNQLIRSRPAEPTEVFARFTLATMLLGLLSFSLVFVGTTPCSLNYVILRETLVSYALLKLQ
jgi:hypothetical protein